MFYGTYMERCHCIRLLTTNQRMQNNVRILYIDVCIHLRTCFGVRGTQNLHRIDCKEGKKMSFIIEVFFHVCIVCGGPKKMPISATNQLGSMKPSIPN